MFTRKNKLMLAAFALITTATAVLGQAVVSGGLWPNLPVVAQSSYCATTTNGVCTQTIPAGPTALTGKESIPVNTGTTNQPFNALVPVGTLGGNPLTVVSVSAANPSNVSATNLDGGVIYNSTVTITAANISLPTNPIQGQLYRIASNRTITTLTVGPGSASQLIASNTRPTALTASTTGSSEGYLFYYNVADTTWYRLQ